MKKRLGVIILSIILLLSAGCEVKSNTTTAQTTTVKNEEINTKNEKTTDSIIIKEVIPFNDRKYVYTNGISVENKDSKTTEDKGVNFYQFYPVIDGLKDKTIQAKINKELKEVGEQQIAKLMTTIEDPSVIKAKQINTNVAYNYNNVIFVDFFASIETKQEGTNFHSIYDFGSYGYDLNTGDRLTMDDLFMPGFDYKSKINDFICKYLIANNYDDYKFERMIKPFQGIRENQSFSFGLEGLRIVIDKQNDEFADLGYSEQIYIPLRYFGDDLYIFDRFYDEGQNIFDKEKLRKQLLPNKMKFKGESIFEESGANYYISIKHGKFVDVPNEEIEKKLNKMVVFSYDIEGFKKKAKALTGKNKYANLMNDINLRFNAGGYISMLTTKYEVIGDMIKANVVMFNYDFNKNKELQLADILTNTADFEKLLRKRVHEITYSLSEDMQNKVVEDALNNERFVLEEGGIHIYLPLLRDKRGSYPEWVWISYDEIGLENIKIFN